MTDDAQRVHRFEGRVAIVTGAAQGIGLAIAERLAGEGAAVVAADISNPAASERVRPSSSQIVPWQLDATSESSWDALVAATADASPTILVNNAGGVVDWSVLDKHSLRAWDLTLALNLTSAFLGMRSVLPSMLERGTGAIVNMCSISGIAGHADAPAYQAAKSGIRALTKSAAIAYGPRGVRINAVTPSIIATPGVARESAEHIDAYVSRVPIGRMGEPGEVAAAVAFLVSDEAAFITGANFPSTAASWPRPDPCAVAARSVGPRGRHVSSPVHETALRSPPATSNIRPKSDPVSNM